MPRPPMLEATPRCGAKTRSGRPCHQPAIKDGNGRCRMHNGRAVKGMAHWHYQGKGYSKYLPKIYREDIERFLRDPEHLAQIEDVAVLDARLAELARKVGSTESGAAWKRLSEDWVKYQRVVDKAAVTSDPATRSALAQEGSALIGGMGEVIRTGAGESALWDEIKDTLAAKTRVAEAERKRRLESQAVYTAQEMVTYFHAIGDAVARHVRDSSVKAALFHDLDRLSLLDSRHALPAGEPAPVGESVRLASDRQT